MPTYTFVHRLIWTDSTVLARSVDHIQSRWPSVGRQCYAGTPSRWCWSTVAVSWRAACRRAAWNWRRRSAASTRRRRSMSPSRPRCHSSPSSCRRPRHQLQQLRLSAVVITCIIREGRVYPPFCGPGDAVDLLCVYVPSTTFEQSVVLSVCYCRDSCSLSYRQRLFEYIYVRFVGLTGAVHAVDNGGD